MSANTMKVHYSATTEATSSWATPWDFFNRLNDEFGFELDVCALPENAKCEKYYTPEIDGLAQEWKGTCWMNPPYGRAIGAWIKKAYDSAMAGNTVVCLLPARTDTRWFHDYCLKSQDIRFVKGRIHFSGKDPAPFPSMVVVFAPKMLNGKGLYKQF